MQIICHYTSNIMNRAWVKSRSVLIVLLLQENYTNAEAKGNINYALKSVTQNFILRVCFMYTQIIYQHVQRMLNRHSSDALFAGHF